MEDPMTSNYPPMPGPSEVDHYLWLPIGM
jgi:hypothetical protein